MTQKTLTVSLLVLLLAACQSPADTAVPTLVSSIPTHLSTDIAPGSGLSLVFSEAMKPASVQVQVTPAVNLGTPVWNDAKTIVYSPLGGWQPGTTYTLNVRGTDLAGNFLSASTLSFQTQTLPDTSAPAAPSGIKVEGRDGEFGLEWSANQESDLAGYTVYFGLTSSALNNTVTVVKPGVNTIVGGLDNGKTYFYAVDAFDASGNHSAKSAVGTVMPKDQTTPKLVSSEPAHATQGLAFVPNLRFGFSEPMDKGSIKLHLCTSDEPPTSATCTKPEPANFGEPTWGQGDTAVQFTPTNQFQPGKTNVLIMSARDKAGNASTSKVSFSLQPTPDSTPPRVISSGWGHDPSSFKLTVMLFFSEAMDQQSVEDAFISQPALPCAWTWQGNLATCAVSGVKPGNFYTVVVGTGAKDLAGNTMITPYKTTVETGS